MQKTMRTISGMSGLAITLGLAACYVPMKGNTNTSVRNTPIAIPKAGPEQVLVDSRWAYSAIENRPESTWLLEQALQTGSDGTTGLEKMVRRWPDVALELLRQSVANQDNLPVRLAIAQAYDRVTEATEPRAGWNAALAASDSHREIYVNFQNSRDNVLTLFRSGRFADAAKIDLSSTLPPDAPPALRIEALRLVGLAFLLCNKPEPAAAQFAQALIASADGPRHEQFELGLLASEAALRTGHTPESIAAWRAAITAGAHIRDPELWERAILAKPDREEWPLQAAITGADDPNFSAGVAPDTANVLIGVGKMYLSRTALQPALLAFSRAQAETVIPGEKALAGLYRSQSMIAMQQAASALPMLESLLECGDPRIARRAQAVQGDVLCRVLDDRQHGLPMMREALQAGQADWPGKYRLVANLGLYEILDGREDQGIQWLHLAQANFEASGQWRDLAESLENEAASLQTAGKIQEAQAAQNRADEICRRAGLPTERLIGEGSKAAKSNLLHLPQ